MTDRIEDKRISEALDLLNATARERRAELSDVIDSKYKDLSSLVSAFANQVKAGATEKFEYGKKKVVDAATDLNKSVHKNSWAYIGAASATALVVGFFLGRARRS